MWLSFMLSAAFVFAGIAVVVFAFLTLQLIISRPINPVEAAAAEVQSIDLQLDQEGPLPEATLAAFAGPSSTPIPTQEPWEGRERVNILAMGIDRRPGQAFVSRTDSIMVVSIDPVSNTASILSVPRDLYVVIPGHGRDRINTAFVYGSRGSDEAAGASLSIQTLEYNLGIPIDHYILVDFSAVTRSIDLLGGIYVDVPYDINDPTFPDMNYGYDPLYIPAGLHHFDGETALKYARTRHMDNDFYRAARQQQVLMSARSQAMSLGVAGLISRAPALYERVQSGVRTDLSLEQLVRLATTAAHIEEQDITREVLGNGYVSPYLTEAGAQVLILDNDQAAPLIARMFYN
jgi:polyisoprenyl-teichoic acid--peptidoglycan teichoic acid transferase